ncbi:hypothetical protein [Pseudidiomarina sp.]|uniref:hypothetical protein n=1 Tax=Pseudidiomarina sp. TaxID=2081707 RepID=UPI003A96C924
MKCSHGFAVLALVVGFFSGSAIAGNGVVITWQNSSGYWFACGPVQCSSSGSRSEEEAMSYVIHEDKHGVSFRNKSGRCYLYDASNVESYENSAEKVYRLAKC